MGFEISKFVGSWSAIGGYLHKIMRWFPSSFEQTVLTGVSVSAPCVRSCQNIEKVSNVKNADFGFETFMV